MSRASGYRYSFETECPVLLSLVCILTCLPIGSVENERGFSALNRSLDQLRISMKPKHTNAVVRLNGQKDKMLADYSPQVLEFLRRVLLCRDVHMVETSNLEDRVPISCLLLPHAAAPDSEGTAWDDLIATLGEVDKDTLDLGLQRISVFTSAIRAGIRVHTSTAAGQYSTGVGGC